MKKTTFRVTTSEVETIRREYTYIVEVDNKDAESFYEDMQTSEGSDIYTLLNQYEHRYISRDEVDFIEDANNSEYKYVERIEQQA